MEESEIQERACAEIKLLNPCMKCGATGSAHLICNKGYWVIGCGFCTQEHKGFTYSQEAVNYWNLENPNE